MKIVINLDLHEAIQDFTVNAPASAYDFKSQDTIDWWIYLVRGGIVQDLGAGFALKFGMVKVGDPAGTLLAYQTVVSHLTDPDGNVYYLCQVDFNTAEMTAAMGAASQINCTIELRYQTADAEIVHTLNIPAVVYATILKETGVTPPHVGSGYPDASMLVLQTEINEPSGVAGLDATGAIYVGQLPPSVEFTTHKDQPGGYPSLTSGGKIPVSEVLIDNSTIVIDPSSGALSAPFVGGDMKKSVYDANNDGIVDHAALADSATLATTATTASGLTINTAPGPLSVVWGRDATGKQNLFAAPSGGGGGSGDMTKAVYDTDNNGAVDKADALRQDSSPGALATVWGRDAAGKQNLFAAPSGGGGGSGLAAIGCTTLAAFTVPAYGSGVIVNVNDASMFDGTIQRDFLVYIGPNWGIMQYQYADSSSSPNTVALKSNQQYSDGATPGTSIPSGSTIVLMGPQVYDSGASTGVTLVTDDQAADTPYLPAIKRLVASDSSIVLDSATSDLAVGIKVSSPPGLKPWQGYEGWTNFNELNLENSNFASATFSSGAIAFNTDNYGKTVTGKVVGSVTLATGVNTDTPSANLAFFSWSTPSTIQIMNGLGPLTFIVRAALQTIPSSNADCPYVALEWADGTGYGRSGFQFSRNYASGDHPNWTVVTKDFSNSDSVVDTSVAVDTNFHRFKVVSSADWKTWTYSIDDVVVQTITRTNVPTYQTPITLRPMLQIAKFVTTATNWKVTIDWVYWQYLFTN